MFLLCAVLGGILSDRLAVTCTQYTPSPLLVLSWGVRMPYVDHPLVACVRNSNRNYSGGAFTLTDFIYPRSIMSHVFLGGVILVEDLMACSFPCLISLIVMKTLFPPELFRRVGEKRELLLKCLRRRPEFS